MDDMTSVFQSFSHVGGECAFVVVLTEACRNTPTSSSTRTDIDFLSQVWLFEREQINAPSFLRLCRQRFEVIYIWRCG